jgi:hypothetical protein
MTILFNACEKINPTTRRFGAGLFAFAPQARPVAHSFDEEAAYAQQLADEAADRREAAREFERAIEDRYVRSYELDRVSSGVPLF